MIRITPLPPERVEEARLVIYRTRYGLGLDADLSWEAALARYRADWPLADMDDLAGAYGSGRGCFFVTMADDRIIGTGALRPLAEDPSGQTVEVKRLWLLQAYQGQGHGFRMMQALLAEARRLGYRRAVLETHRAEQRRAWEFYLRLGFSEIPRYGDDPDDAALSLLL